MEIYILNPHLDAIGVINTYSAFIWTTKYNEVGTFQLEVLFSKELNEQLIVGNIIYKTDEEDDASAIITRKNIKMNQNGSQTIEVRGYLIGKILGQRIIWQTYNFNTSVESAMRSLVDSEVINPTDNDRRINEVSLGDEFGIVERVEMQVSYKNLLSTLSEIAQTYDIGYRLRLDFESKKLKFEVYKGTDRTIGTDEPCIFSRDFNNVISQQYNEDITNYSNVALVGGAGEGDLRVKTVVNPTSATGINRREIFVDAKSKKDASVNELKESGMEKLSSLKYAKAFTTDVDWMNAMYFKLGDKVSCYDTELGIQLDTRVMEIEKAYSLKEYNMRITLGDGVPSLIKLIKADKEV